MYLIIMSALLSISYQQIEEKEYEKAYIILENINIRYVDYSKYWYSKALCEFSILKKDKCLKSLDKLQDSFEIPYRYQKIAEIMRASIEEWQDRDLGDVVRRMRESADRLEIAKGGPVTQQKQKEIVKILDELIKEKEDAAQAAKELAEKKIAQSQKQDGPIQQPQDDSKIEDDAGPGQVLEKQLKHYQSQWGKMSEKERARAIQGLTKDVPPKYREMVETYFKLLNKHFENNS